MKLLPKWIVTNKFPAVYDSESATAIEQTAKVYGAMNELIEDYNKFVDNVNDNISAFENGMFTNYETFKISMSQQFQDFIDVVELRFKELETDVIETSQKIINKAIKDGDFMLIENYNEETESLNIAVTGGV